MKKSIYQQVSILADNLAGDIARKGCIRELWKLVIEVRPRSLPPRVRNSLPSVLKTFPPCNVSIKLETVLRVQSRERVTKFRFVSSTTSRYEFHYPPRPRSSIPSKFPFVLLFFLLFFTNATLLGVDNFHLLSRATLAFVFYLHRALLTGIYSHPRHTARAARVVRCSRISKRG